MKWRVLLLIVSAWLVSASSLSAQPVITDLQPRGVQKGKPFTLTLTGRNLGEGAKIRSTMPASFTLLTPDQPALMQSGPMAGEGRYATFLVEPAADLAVRRIRDPGRHDRGHFECPAVHGRRVS